VSYFEYFYNCQVMLKCSQTHFDAADFEGVGYMFCDEYTHCCLHCKGVILISKHVCHCRTVLFPFDAYAQPHECLSYLMFLWQNMSACSRTELFVLVASAVCEEYSYICVCCK